ncbi:flagellar biosynthesis repressor FlbT [Methylobacterium sp. Leaf456]|uniref:flagellar biosynthesis repressor FlbT n=1 Tax=Methylobacterium sp. Leaf456 TaxID=1736382 RepID=UPI0009E6CD12|nr:flagellar biosynthesis repressor FlbT [Methylobacterium sp. Leaf456]
MARDQAKVEKSAARTMHLNLRAGERVYINGAVVRADRKVSLELMNDATFLLEGHVLQPDAATTPLRQLYFAAQTMLIEPAQTELARTVYGTLQDNILAATTEPAIRTGLKTASGLVDAGRPFEALKVIRGLYAAEAALIEGAGLDPVERIGTRFPAPKADTMAAKVIP